LADLKNPKYWNHLTLKKLSSKQGHSKKNTKHSRIFETKFIKQLSKEKNIKQEKGSRYYPSARSYFKKIDLTTSETLENAIKDVQDFAKVVERHTMN